MAGVFERGNQKRGKLVKHRLFENNCALWSVIVA